MPTMVGWAGQSSVGSDLTHLRGTHRQPRGMRGSGAILIDHFCQPHIKGIYHETGWGEQNQQRNSLPSVRGCWCLRRRQWLRGP